MKGVFERVKGVLLMPVDDRAEVMILNLKPGQGVTLEARKARNIKFHRLFFALLKLAFDMWTPPEDRKYRGHVIQKNFENFRESMLILAGYYDAVYGVDGTVQLKAKSISVLNCDEVDFREVYTGVLNVVWERVLRDANFRSKEEVDRVVNQLMAFG